MSRRSGRGRRMGLNAEINVVSLIDVILLLLLIFMITAPMMTSGIDITLPTADVQPLESRDAIVVTVDRTGGVFVDGKPWSEDELRGAFAAYRRSRDHVTLRLDASGTNEVSVRVMSLLTTTGVKSFGIEAIPERTGR